ncbi:subclass B1 metallo-beta-lactamase [Rhodocytophaga rosea]|uniref:beta-lactamase n=1 Tax=Rhodocytophaga rosea TaxID=2704465 RepID=A0A6C0GDP7_9BACT|nr:subclass B1 metallo-beta-lactamase [Rhodocytophaga rosea]QHT65800.1 subclass B1 metallo-beta-lactamase [Rhodocytophaga rosea]
MVNTCLRLILLIVLIGGCSLKKLNQPHKNYKSETLTIQQVSDHVCQHISYLQTESFGNVPCNGMIVFDKNEAIIFDTAPDTTISAELITWVEKELNCKIKAIIPTHFHSDCLGGLEAFHRRQIHSYANNTTIQLATSNHSAVPANGFDKMLELKVGSRKVIAEFIGEGHTKDNIIGYFPDENIMFGGCLIKEVGAGKGNLADATVQDWPSTVTALKQKYAATKLVIPGHGKTGGTELFDYTIQLFQQK